MTIEERCHATYDLDYEHQVPVRQLPQSALSLLDDLFKKEDLVLHLPINRNDTLEISKASNISSKQALFFPTYDPLIVYEPPYSVPLVVINRDFVYIRNEDAFRNMLRIINNFDPINLSKKLGRCIFCLSDHADSLEPEQCTKKKSSRKNKKSRYFCDSTDSCPVELSQVLQSEKVFPYVDPTHSHLMNRIELEGLSRFNEILSSLLSAGLVLDNGLLTFPADRSKVPEKWSRSHSEESTSDSETDEIIQINNAIRVEYIQNNGANYYLVSHYPKRLSRQLLELGGKQREDRKWIIPLSSENKLLKLVDNINNNRKRQIIDKFLSDD